MTTDDFQSKLDELRSLPDETEWVEFKHNDHGEAKYQEIGEYLSALSNSLALLHRECGYIAWGIEDKTHNLVGTDFRPKRAKKGSESLENWLTRGLKPQVRFWIHEKDIDGKHFALIEVSAATHTPISFRGEEYVRVGSHKKKLRTHPEKERELWSILQHEDWSAHICENASLNDLDPMATSAARDVFREKNPNLADEINDWSDVVFLNKAKLCIDGKITRAAIILLGKP